MKKNKINTLIPISALMLTASVAQGVIVYEDNFGGNIGNPDVGGEIISGTNITAADPFEDAGLLVAQTNNGNRLAYGYTENQFALTGGFTLEVVFVTADSGNPSYNVGFGIVDEVTATVPAADGTGDSGNLNGFLGTDKPDLNAVGFSAINNTNTIGLNADFGTLETKSTALNSAIDLGTTQTFTLTVNADGSASFGLSGGTNPAETGTLSAGELSALFDDSADGEYHFAVYSQGNSGLQISSVSIDAVAVPEPSSTALLGLGGLALILRRRK